MDEIFKKIEALLQAYYPVLYLTSFEYERTKQKVRTAIADVANKHHIFEWNCVEGLYQIDKESRQEVENMEEPEELLKHILSITDRSYKDVFILEDFNNYIEEPRVKHLMRIIADKARFTNTHVIIVSASYKLPTELEKYVTVLNIPLPNRYDIDKTLQQVERDTKISLTAEHRNRLIDAALGMTSMEADLAFCLAAVKDNLGNNSPYIVSSEKEQIIRKSGILDYFPKNESLKDVGGMDELKEWLQKRQMAYEKNARDWGLQEPKGLLLLGVPGCGKSLTAKSIASFWNMPLLRLDIGKVYQGLVGSSEDNIRKAIMTAEAVAPCVLWIDEIEKGLSGVQSSGATDGGVTSRIFSTILTWMQEKTTPVFVVATANNINLLPPELLRKGRFDEIFFVDLPNKEERKKIFSIHLEKKGQNPSDFALDSISEKTEGFNGAEIEECIKEAMFAAYIQNPKAPTLLTKHIVDAIEATVPLSQTMCEQITSLRKWAATRAKSATKQETKLPAKEMPILLTRPELEMERSFNLSIKDELLESEQSKTK